MTETLERKVRRIVPWYEEAIVGTIKRIPYGIGATVVAAAAEQWTSSQSFIADVGIALPVATTLVTLEALTERFTEECESLSDKIVKAVPAGVLAAGVCGVTYLGAALATQDAKEAGQALVGAVAGYVGLKGLRLAKLRSSRNAALAIGAISVHAMAAYDFHTIERTEVLRAPVPVVQEERIEPVSEMPKQEPEKIPISYTASPPFTISPLNAEALEISSCFAYRGNNVRSRKTKGSVHHPGVDVHARFGEPVYAVGNGIVTETDPNRWGRVRIYHGNNMSTGYLHMNTIDVHVGDKVIAGETVLGFVGGRGPQGRSQYQPHLHFEVYNGNISPKIRGQVSTDALMTRNSVNPLCYLSTDLLEDIRNNTGCLAQGGWDKFCTDYVAYTDSSDELAITKRMLTKIGEDYTDELNTAVVGTMVTPVLLTAMSGVESRGKADAGVGTGAVGILQFIAPTAYGFDLCDNKHCIGRDDRTDAAKEFHAAARYIDQLTKKYWDYSPDEDAFAIAAYNAGSGVIDAAITRTNKDGIIDGDVTWEEVADRITPKLVCKAYKWRPSKENLATCAAKAEIVKDYVQSVLRYQALLLDQPFESQLAENK